MLEHWGGLLEHLEGHAGALGGMLERLGGCWNI